MQKLRINESNRVIMDQALELRPESFINLCGKLWQFEDSKSFKL